MWYGMDMMGNVLLLDQWSICHVSYIPNEEVSRLVLFGCRTWTFPVILETLSHFIEIKVSQLQISVKYVMEENPCLTWTETHCIYEWISWMWPSFLIPKMFEWDVPLLNLCYIILESPCIVLTDFLYIWLNYTNMV